MNNIKPYFVEDIEAQLKAAYFATIRDGLGAAKVIFLLCLAYDIKPSWMKPEHQQALMKEFEKG